MKRNELSQVLGYFAATSTTVLCDGTACVITGSKETMQRYIRQSGEPSSRYTIRKTRLHEVLEGLVLGGEYAFDETAWERCRPWLEKHMTELGTDIPEEGEDLGIPLVHVSPMILDTAVI